MDVTAATFEREVLEASSRVPVLVDFWAPWCAPCRRIAPLLEQIAGDRDDLRIVKLNVDDNMATAAQYGIMTIPSLIVFQNGTETQRLRPVPNRSALEGQLQLEPAA